VVVEHWRDVNRAADRAGVVVRPLSTLDDADRLIEVTVATWGVNVATREVFRALMESGNAPYGALAGDALVGVVWGWLGVGEDGPHVHSHVLAVLEPWRARGIGYVLKLAQRAASLDQGLTLVRWTFDPLLSRNAHFNFNKLGVIGDRFERNFYGEMDDAFNVGERTDRLEIVRRIHYPRVVAALGGDPDHDGVAPRW
jgi:predicted GNAT superfamily acetyltransferase